MIESGQLARDRAGSLQELTTKLGMPFNYKSALDKANRSSAKSACLSKAAFWEISFNTKL